MTTTASTHDVRQRVLALTRELERMRDENRVQRDLLGRHLRDRFDALQHRYDQLQQTLRNWTDGSIAAAELATLELHAAFNAFRDQVSSPSGDTPPDHN